MSSSLGGSPRDVRCPWCEGSGTWAGAEHDAQEHAPDVEKRPPPAEPPAASAAPEAP